MNDARRTHGAPRHGGKRTSPAYKPIWCPGCGDYSVLGSMTKALASLDLPPRRSRVVSGIGCSSRIPAYTNCYGFHGVHGRSLAAATGLKVARPDLTVLVAGGDGDGYSIGGNHFMHACRRNVDLTLHRDGQPRVRHDQGPAVADDRARLGLKLSPGRHRNSARSIRSSIALASGANFVARAFSGDPNGTADILAQAIRHPGFSFVEILLPVRDVPSRAARVEDAGAAGAGGADDDASRAARRLMTDDGFNVGVLYVGDRAPCPFGPVEPVSQVEDLEAEFAP